MSVRARSIIRAGETGRLGKERGGRVKRGIPSSAAVYSLRLPSVRRSLVFLLVSILCAALAGRAAATRPASQIILVLAGLIFLALGAAAGRAGRTSVEFFGSVVLLTGALADAPRNYIIGSITALGAITIGYAIVGSLLWIAQRGSRLPSPGLRVYGWFVVWAIISFWWHPPSIQGFQNVAVFAVFAIVASLAAAACSATSGTADHLARWFDMAIVLAVALYLVSVVIGGFESEAILSPRAFALFALLGLPRTLARFRYESRLAAWIGVALVAALFASLSRTALVICAILVPLAWLDRRSLSRRVGVLLFVAFSVGVFALAALTVGPLQKRFSEPDRVIVGGVDLSVSGRGVFWSATWQSFLESPVIGRGAGSSETVVKEKLTIEQRRLYSHPHNDYLRLLHDYGVIGCGLWFIGFVALLRRTRRAWIAAVAAGSSSATYHMTAFLALLGLGLSMITDNAIVYIYVMAPLGLLVGTSLGLSAATSRDVPHPHALLRRVPT
jgi:O-antigen ligase